MKMLGNNSLSGWAKETFLTVWFFCFFSPSTLSFAFALSRKFIQRWKLFVLRQNLRIQVALNYRGEKSRKTRRKTSHLASLIENVFTSSISPIHNRFFLFINYMGFLNFDVVSHLVCQSSKCIVKVISPPRLR